MRNATLSRRVGRLETVNRSHGPQADLERRALAQATVEDLELLLEASELVSKDWITVEQRAALSRYEHIYRYGGNGLCAEIATDVTCYRPGVR